MSHVHNVTLKLTGSHPRIKKKKKKKKKEKKLEACDYFLCCKYCYIWKANDCHIEMRLLDV